MSNQVYANMMEVSCKAGAGKTICAFPDVCMTPPQTPATPPGVPIPYPNTGMASDTTDGSSTVKISGKEVMLKNKSYFKKSTGDEAGCAPKKGVVTSKNTGKVYFNMWSMDVKVEGENVVRHLDITTHNHASAPGNSPPMPHTDELAGGGGAPAESCEACAPKAGSPVNPITGAKVLHGIEDLDFTLDGPLPLHWQRTYNSSNRSDGWFGRGWSSPLEVSLLAITDRTGLSIDHLEHVDGFGRRIQFQPLERGASHFNPAERLTLMRSDSGQYRLRRADGVTCSFGEAAGMVYPLIALSDRNGNTIRIDHRSVGGQASMHVACSGGQQLQLVFNRQRLAQVLLQRASDPSPRIVLVDYQYTSFGDLSRVTDRGGACVRSFEYNDTRLMCKQVYAGAFEAWYDYHRGSDPQKVKRHWDNVGRSWIFEYHADHTAVTDQTGRLTLYHFDDHKRWTGYTDALGQFTARGYDRFGNVRAVIDPAERVTEAKYDENGLPCELIDPTGAVTTIEWHPTLGVPLSVSDALGRVTRCEYDERGNLLAQIDPDGALTRFLPDARGMTTTIIDANGGTKHLQYNERAQLARYTDCSGRSTDFLYDADGHLTSISNALGELVRFDRNVRGRITRETLPDGSFKSYDWDLAGRMVATENALGARTQYRYDPDGNLVEKIDTLDHRMTYRYDLARRLVEIRNENSDAHRFEYDQLDRINAEERFDGVRVEYTYGHSDHVIETVEAPGTVDELRTRYTRDAMGRLLRRVGNDTSTTFAYDAAGQMTQAHSEHDDVAVRMTYDECGRLTSETVQARPRQYVMGFAYDALGNRLVTTLPDGRRIATSYYGSGYAHQIRVDEKVVSDIERDVMHREVQRTQGRLQMAREYDGAGRLQRQGVFSGALPAEWNPWCGDVQPLIDRRFAYDIGGRLTAVLEHGHRTAYSYDALDQLTRSDDELFAFDPAHNVLDPSRSAGSAVGRVERNRLTVFEDKRYRYDALGRVVEKRIGAHKIVQLRWNAEHRLVESVTTGPKGVGTVRYRYDPLGRRIAKSNDARTSWYIWEGDRLVQQFDDVTDYTFLYEAETHVPLAMVACSTGDVPTARQVYYYHADNVGFPRELTDEGGSIVWQGRSRAWGQLAEERSTSTNTSFVQPLRLQGQYHDEQTGLHYNLNRYYDPDCGRFMNPDPIGLLGGYNTYQYAPNPTGWIDPLGLAVCKLSAADKETMGPPPEGMERPHYHHIVRETAPVNWPAADRQHILDSQKILEKHEIGLNDDLRNFCWAPNRGHSKERSKKIADELRKADKIGKEEVVKTLERLGKAMTAGTM